MKITLAYTGLLISTFWLGQTSYIDAYINLSWELSDKQAYFTDIHKIMLCMSVIKESSQT